MRGWPDAHGNSDHTNQKMCIYCVIYAYNLLIMECKALSDIPGKWLRQEECDNGFPNKGEGEFCF
jgi:hypothetical protein